MPIIEITLSQAAATRLQNALQETLNLSDEEGAPRAATMADAKEYIVSDLKQLIRTSERRVATLNLPAGTDPAIG
jgi:hypothetical protein